MKFSATRSADRIDASGPSTSAMTPPASTELPVLAQRRHTHVGSMAANAACATGTPQTHARLLGQEDAASALLRRHQRQRRHVAKRPVLFERRLNDAAHVFQVEAEWSFGRPRFLR